MLENAKSTMTAPEILMINNVIPKFHFYRNIGWWGEHAAQGHAQGLCKSGMQVPLNMKSA